MNKKFELLENEKEIWNGKILFRIRALTSFGDVKAGDLGGYIEKEDNLSTVGKAWVTDEAWVSDQACVDGHARVAGQACVGGEVWVSGHARVAGEAIVTSNTDYLTIGPIGSRDDTITFYRTRTGGISAAVGCFKGTIDEFAAEVKKTHGNNKYAKAYLQAAELAKLWINLDTDKRRNHDGQA